MGDFKIKKVYFEICNGFDERAVLKADFVEFSFTWENYYSDTIDKDNYGLQPWEYVFLEGVFERCADWQAEYVCPDELPPEYCYYWKLDIDGKIYCGKNAAPDDWEEFIDELSPFTTRNTSYDLLHFIGFDDFGDYSHSIDTLCEEMKEEHPQTYYRGVSLYKKGNVVDIKEINKVKTIATVMGSKGDKYTVTLYSWNNIGQDIFECSCPSNQPICKHIVAAVIAANKAFVVQHYHEAVKDGTLIGEFEINDDDLERLALLVDESIVNLRRKDFVGISVCEKFIESVAETLNEDCRRVMQGLDWYGMAIVPWFPRLKMQELSWGLRAIISQVRSPSMDTEARRFYEKVKNGELITDETRARDRGRMRYCPLMGKEITDEVCFDINMHVDEGAPKRTVPKEILSVEGYKEICLKCEKHGNE